MKKFILMAMLCASVVAKAQNSGSAAQTISLSLTDAIEITFNTTGNATGELVRIPFANPAAYSGGVQTADYQLTIRSNKKFNLSVNTNNPFFTYSGNVMPAPKMPVAGTLSIMPTTNGSGGNIPSPFALSRFSSISERIHTLVSGGSNGGNQSVSVKYKADPKFSYPGGTYTVDAIFTATQM